MVRIAHQTTCSSREAGNKSCALLCVLVATSMPASIRTVPVLLCADRKRRFGQHQHSRGLRFCEVFSFVPFLTQRDYVLIGADCSSNNMHFKRSRWQVLCFVVCACCSRDASLAPNCACPAARRSQTTNSTSNNILGEFFL